jgi:hypothetical protein
MTIFIPNKYTRWYYNIIFNAETRQLSGYKERHHIIPKSLGGSNSKENIVNLTAKEHFVCHHLLIKMVTGDAKRKMSYAAWLLCNLKNPSQLTRYVPNARIYEDIRKLHATAMSTKFKGVKKTYSYWKDKTHSDESKELQSLGKQREKNPMWGKKHRQLSIDSIIAAQKNIPKPKFTCVHCNTTVGGKSNLLRWHNDNCKLKEML